MNQAIESNIFSQDVKYLLEIDGYENEELDASTLDEAKKEAIQSMHYDFDNRDEAGRKIYYSIEERRSYEMEGIADTVTGHLGVFVVDETYAAEIGDSPHDQEASN